MKVEQLEKLFSDERLPHARLLEPKIGPIANGGTRPLLCRGHDGQHRTIWQGNGELQEISRRLQVETRNNLTRTEKKETK